MRIGESSMKELIPAKEIAKDIARDNEDATYIEKTLAEVVLRLFKRVEKLEKRAA